MQSEIWVPPGRLVWPPPPRWPSDQNFEENPTVTTRALQDKQRHRLGASRMGSEQVGSEDRAASPLLWRRQRCKGDVGAKKIGLHTEQHQRCTSDVARASDPILQRPRLESLQIL
ncbi:unnamed protein product [Prorocentrum cordatum]|uniref:Uncharacterized protein n=1 Tax=Prorocentrum cordatum TaxID=2364126 RepID=A0ABN9XQY0_9DINO|nr:unnamed protein product [Polarella glacialis]